MLVCIRGNCSTSEAVQGAALPLEGIDDVHGGHRLPLGVLGVGDGIADYTLQEHLEHPAGLLVDEARDALDASSASETADGWLGDALDVVAKDLPMTLGASLSETFATFSTARHDELSSLSFELSLRNQKTNDPNSGLPPLLYSSCREADHCANRPTTLQIRGCNAHALSW